MTRRARGMTRLVVYLLLIAVITAVALLTLAGGIR